MASYHKISDGTPDGAYVLHGKNPNKRPPTNSEKKSDTIIRAEKGKLPSRKLDSNDLDDVVGAATKQASRDDVDKLQHLMRLLSTEDKPCTQKELAVKLNAKVQDLSRFMRREKGATLPPEIKSRANNLLKSLEKKH